MAKCRRNVENFLDACKKLGVPQVFFLPFLAWWSCGLLSCLLTLAFAFVSFCTGQIVLAPSHLGGARSGQGWRHCTGIAGSSIIKTQPAIYHVALLYHGTTSSIPLPSSSLYPQITSQCWSVTTPVMTLHPYSAMVNRSASPLPLITPYGGV